MLQRLATPRRSEHASSTLAATFTKKKGSDRDKGNSEEDDSNRDERAISMTREPLIENQSLDFDFARTVMEIETGTQTLALAQRIQ